MSLLLNLSLLTNQPFLGYSDVLYFYLTLILDEVLPCIHFIFNQTSLEVDVVIVEMFTAGRIEKKVGVGREGENLIKLKYII